MDRTPAILPATIPPPDLTGYDRHQHCPPSAIILCGQLAMDGCCLSPECATDLEAGTVAAAIYTTIEPGFDDGRPWECHSLFLCLDCLERLGAEGIRCLLLSEGESWLRASRQDLDVALEAAKREDGPSLRFDGLSAAEYAEFASHHIRAAAAAIVMPGQTWTPEAFPSHPVDQRPMPTAEALAQAWPGIVAAACPGDARLPSGWMQQLALVRIEDRSLILAFPEGIESLLSHMLPPRAPAILAAARIALGVHVCRVAIEPTTAPAGAACAGPSASPFPFVRPESSPRAFGP
jgi:hypothetical protein